MYCDSPVFPSECAIVHNYHSMGLSIYSWYNILVNMYYTLIVIRIHPRPFGRARPHIPHKRRAWTCMHAIQKSCMKPCTYTMHTYMYIVCAIYMYVHDLNHLWNARKEGNATQQKDKATQHNSPKTVIFQRKKLPRVGFKPTTVAC